MAQRNIDSEFYNTHFVRGLPGPYKALWAWLQLNCNHAGIWEIDIDVARMRTGFFDLEIDKAEQLFAAKILPLRGGEKWFLKDYCNDQFKTIFLNPTNTYHWGAIVILQKLALMDNDFIVLDEQMQVPCKPLYSNSKDAKIKIKGIYYKVNSIEDNNTNEPREEITIKATSKKIKTAPVDEMKRPVNGCVKTFVTPLVEAFRDFKEMRVKIRKPMTERAVSMIHTELTKLAGDNEELKIAILNQSTRNCWQDVFALKDKGAAVLKNSTVTKAENIISIATAAEYREA